MLQHVIRQNGGEIAIAVGSGAVTGSVSQGVYVTSDGEIEANLDGTITHHANGLPFDANGRLVVSTDPVSGFSSGYPITSAGAIALSADAGAYVYNGLPAVAGALAGSGLYGPELVVNGDFETV